MQWTPYTKYTNWITGEGYSDPSEMDANIHRIEYEVQNNIQWGNDSLGNRPPYDFEGYTQSTDTAYNLAINFLRYYERPADYNQPIRGTQAENWYNYLQNISPEPPEPPEPPTPKNKYWKNWLFIRNKKIYINY